MKSIFNTNSLIRLGIIFLLFLTLSCKDDEVSNPSEEPPDIPPLSSFKMDFNQFPLTSVLLKNAGHNSLSNIQAKENWGWATFNVVFWQTYVNVGMIIPVASFAASLNNDPERMEDGRWLWTYDFNPLGGVKYTAKLYGELAGLNIIWEMYISKENEFDDFLWYYGQSDLLGTTGSWTLNKEPEEPTPWIGIEWNRNPEENTGNIKYTNIVPNGEENGGYIFFELTSDEDYNAFYEIFKKSQNNTISVKWNTNSKNGRVKDSVHFGDDEWHCWDTDFEDADCE